MRELSIEWTPKGYVVYDLDADGIAISPPYDEKSTAEAFKHGVWTGQEIESE